MIFEAPCCLKEGTVSYHCGLKSRKWDLRSSSLSTLEIKGVVFPFQEIDPKCYIFLESLLQYQTDRREKSRILNTLLPPCKINWLALKYWSYSFVFLYFWQFSKYSGYFFRFKRWTPSVIHFFKVILKPLPICLTEDDWMNMT
jgi:hypothetical protein